MGKSGPAAFKVTRALVLWFVALVMSIVVVVALFGTTFPIVHTYRPDEARLLAVKTVVFVVLFIPPFYYAGTLLTALFARHQDAIGRIYAADLFAAGAAAAATPLLFGAFDLPVLVGVLALCPVAALVAVVGDLRSRRVSVLLAAASIVAAGLVSYFDGSYDLSRLGKEGERVTELAHRWNQYSRVSLTRIVRNDGSERFRVLHDNAESNVQVFTYDPTLRPTLGWWRDAADLPFVLGRKVESALVMFAGAGAQMIEIDAYSGYTARVRGVEINPLVKSLPERAPELKKFRLREFYTKPNIDLVITEGRHFLNKDEDTYDFLFAASDAPTSQFRTAHTRKYLDTYEALHAYFARLKPGGLIAFDKQPALHRLPALRHVLADLAIPAPERTTIVLAARRRYIGEENLTVLISPSGFSDDDVTKVLAAYPNRQILYAPGQEGHPRFVEMMTGPLPDRSTIVTDDKPYIEPIVLGELEAFPPIETLMQPAYYRKWIRVATVAFLCLLVVLTLVVIGASRSVKPPAFTFVYLVVTGIAYMLCQVSLIGKLELFLGSPLLSMALLLALFLISNGLGSTLVARVTARVPIGAVLLATSVIALVTVVFVDLATDLLLGAPLLVRLVISMVLVAPLGTALGAFYPYAVADLGKRGKEAAVSVTFALSTLSSVVGASFAMLVVVNIGYGALSQQAALLYALLGFATLAIDRARGAAKA